MATKKTAAWYARRYTDRFGFHLVPIEPGRKFPKAADWGHNTLTDPNAAQHFYDQHPDWNMGVALGPSGLCSLDIDDYDSFSLICEAFGFDLDALVAKTPTIQGQAPGLRLMFRVPDGVDLPYCKMNWPNQLDPDGSKHRELMVRAKEARSVGDTEAESQLRAEARQYAKYTVFELRSATDGSQKQDVIPPSIHPVTQQPYRWVTQPVAADQWPTPPPWLLTIWTEYKKIRPQLMAVCPWSVAPEVRPTAVRDTHPRYTASGATGVVSEYNRSVSIESALAAYGYERRGQRWLSPHSGTQLPGVVALPDGDKVYIHHASDPLCSVDTGQPVSAFDLFCYYDHGGDFKRASQAVADLLGIRADVPVHHATLATGTIDADTGEIIPDTGDLSVTPAASVDYISPLPWANSKGKPYKHHENLAEICRRLNVTVRYNVIKKAEEILVPGATFTVDNRDNASLAWLMSQCSVFDFSTANVQDFVTLLAEQNLYNPVASWITSKPWDGKPRLYDLFDTVRVTGGEPHERLRDSLIKRWMLSAVAAAFNHDGVSAHGVLVFQGAQSIGKTSWFKRLVPAELDVLADGLMLRPDDKDSVKQVVSNWLVELGELDATFRKSDIAALKSFLTRNRDEIRLPYARKESQFARRTVFFGSVNPKEYLHDDTGNRRYWTIECASLDYEHDLDMQQVWAEVHDLYLQGEQHWLTPDESDQLNENNEDYTSVDPIQERLMHALEWDTQPAMWRWEQVTQVLIECGIDRPTRADVKTAAAFIRERNGGTFRRVKGTRQMLCPARKIGPI